MSPEMLLTRKAVWDLLCDLEMNIRYYRSKSDQLKGRFKAIRFVLLASVILEGFLLYWGTTASWALIVAVVFGMFMAALALWDALSNYAESATILRFAAGGCDELQLEAERLWRDIQAYSISRDDAEREYARIRERWSRIDAKVTVEDDVRLCGKCSEDANAVMRSRYAE